MSDENISLVGQKLPLPLPMNCKTPCCYGYGRAFCFPCYADITGLKVSDKREAATKSDKTEQGRD